jgi:hypothetical protein
VDIFDGATRTWSTARLSAGRAALTATSLPSQGLALFAGGFHDGALLLFESVFALEFLQVLMP